mgnify:CR=1 FL=1
MKALDDREMEAVLGHELTHIRNGEVPGTNRKLPAAMVTGSGGGAGSRAATRCAAGAKPTRSSTPAARNAMARGRRGRIRGVGDVAGAGFGATSSTVIAAGGQGLRGYVRSTPAK